MEGAFNPWAAGLGSCMARLSNTWRRGRALDEERCLRETRWGQGKALTGGG